MKGTYIVYTNISREGWHCTLKTPNRNTFEYYLMQLLTYDEPVAVITKYRADKCDYPLICFHNKITQKKIELQRAYRLLPKD